MGVVNGVRSSAAGMIGGLVSVGEGWVDGRCCFGRTYANGLRRRWPRPGDQWHLDEVFITIGGKTHYLWRAVDQDGVVLDVLVTSHRDAKAATRFFRTLLRGVRSVPRVLVTDRLASDGVAHRRLMPGVEHRRSKYLNNRAENSPQPTRARERAMTRFRSAGSRKKLTCSFRGWCSLVWYGRSERGPWSACREVRGRPPRLRDTAERPPGTSPTTVLIFYGFPVARNGFCPRSAGYHRTSGPVVTCSTPKSTAARWPTASVSGTTSPG